MIIIIINRRMTYIAFLFKYLEKKAYIWWIFGICLIASSKKTNYIVIVVREYNIHFTPWKPFQHIYYGSYMFVFFWWMIILLLYIYIAILTGGQISIGIKTYMWVFWKDNKGQENIIFSGTIMFLKNSWWFW